MRERGWLWNAVLARAIYAPSRSRQQLSIVSSYHRQGPFHVRRGSTDRAFKTIIRVLNPQKAGSDWVELQEEIKSAGVAYGQSWSFSVLLRHGIFLVTHNCSIKEKKDLSPPFCMDDRKMALPLVDDNAMQVGGSSLL